ncbi:MAG: thioredoxin family protein [Thioalkalispiraceae bacterium]|jgi:hypothetical protein
MPSPEKTEALLLISPGCVHCPVMMSHLTTLLKEGALSKLQILNIQDYPEIASANNVRSVPWLKLGDYTLTGSQSLAQIRNLLQQANSEQGTRAYIEQQLAEGELDKILDEVRQHPEWLNVVIELLADEDTAMQVRLGIDSIMEQMAGSEALQAQVEALAELAQRTHPSRLADIIYYLGLSKTRRAIPYIEQFLQHDNPDIVETCKEALQAIQSAQ